MISLLFVFAFNFSTFAQIENEIRNYVDSTEMLMINGRKLLVNLVSEGKFEKSQEVYRYLQMKAEERNCAVFTFNEQLLLSIYFKDWEEVFSLMEKYSSEEIFLCFKTDPIDKAILSALKTNMPVAEDVSLIVSLEKDEYDLLNILFYYLNYGSADSKYVSLITGFRTKYPHSKYLDFVNNYYPEIKKKEFFSYVLGPGLNYPGGQLYNYFETYPEISISADLSVSRIFISVYMNGSFVRLKKPLTLINASGITHNFVPGDSFQKMDMGVKTGYFLVRNKIIHIAPYASLLAGGYMESLLYRYNSGDNTEFTAYNGLTPGLGACFEMKLFKYNMKNIPFYSYIPFINNINGFVGLKLDTGFNTVFKNSTQPVGGVFSYVKMGLSFGFGEF